MYCSEIIPFRCLAGYRSKRGQGFWQGNCLVRWLRIIGPTAVFSGHMIVESTRISERFIGYIVKPHWVGRISAVSCKRKVLRWRMHYKLVCTEAQMTRSMGLSGGKGHRPTCRQPLKPHGYGVKCVNIPVI
jgi:hypothetical protein